MHAGFWAAYASVREQVLLAVARTISEDVKEVLNTPPLIRHVHGVDALDLESLLKNNNTYINDILESYHLQFCGHSLGGALAALAALDISTNIESIVRAALKVNLPEGYSKDSASYLGKFFDVRAMQVNTNQC